TVNRPRRQDSIVHANKSQHEGQLPVHRIARLSKSESQSDRRDALLARRRAGLVGTVRFATSASAAASSAALAQRSTSSRTCSRSLPSKGGIPSASKIQSPSASAISASAKVGSGN